MDVGTLVYDEDSREGFGFVQFVRLIVVALDVDEEDEDMARLDRFEFTQVAPVDVMG